MRAAIHWGHRTDPDRRFRSTTWRQPLEASIHQQKAIFKVSPSSYVSNPLSRSYIHFQNTWECIFNIFSWVIQTHQTIKYKCVLKEEFMSQVNTVVRSKYMQQHSQMESCTLIWWCISKELDMFISGSVYSKSQCIVQSKHLYFTVSQSTMSWSDQILLILVSIDPFRWLGKLCRDGLQRVRNFGYEMTIVCIVLVLH